MKNPLLSPSLELYSPLTRDVLKTCVALAADWPTLETVPRRFGQRVLAQAQRLRQEYPELAETPARHLARNLFWGTLDEVSAEEPAAGRLKSYKNREATIARFFQIPEPGCLGVVSGQGETDKQPNLYVVSGIPGSGKSTWIETQLAAKDNCLVSVSTDELRAELLGNAEDQSRNSDVFAHAYRLVRKYLRSGKSVVFDATGIMRKHRTVAWRIATACQCRRVVVIFDTPLRVALARNLKRSRNVPDAVMTRFFLQWQRPPAGEADERIIVPSVTRTED